MSDADHEWHLWYDDQARIATRMLAVLEAAANGLDLEAGPFPVKTMPLEMALAKLETMHATLG